MLGDRKTAVLRGGAPWGFRLSGGGLTPIYVAKVFFFVAVFNHQKQINISLLFLIYRFVVEVRQHLAVLQQVIHSFLLTVYHHYNILYVKLMM